MKIWENVNFADVGLKADFSLERVAYMPMFKSALQNDSKVFECAESGNFSKNRKFFLEKIEEMGGKLIYKYFAQTDILLYLWEDSMLELHLSRGYLSFTAISHREELITDLRKLFKDNFITVKKQGHVYAIVSQGGGLTLASIGNAGIPLVRVNYTKEVMSSYDYVVKDLNSSSPSGRVAILEGVPGTGKTHIVRAMLLEVPQSIFILVSPDMVSSLGGPQLLPLLLQYKNYSKGPIILVLEDADKCLVSRAEKEGNTSVIQSILNLGDGILGSMLDIRIIATTNANKFEMDSAILRPGRLSKRLEVGTLDWNTACNVYKNLLPDSTLPVSLEAKKVYTPKSLAEIYSLARENGWIPAPTVKDEEYYDEDDTDESYDEDEDDDD